METAISGLDDSFECCICANHFFIPVSLYCQHVFCMQCILGIVGNSCPICRRPFEKKSIYQENLIITGSMRRILGEEAFKKEFEQRRIEFDEKLKTIEKSRFNQLKRTKLVEMIKIFVRLVFSYYFFVLCSKAFFYIVIRR